MLSLTKASRSFTLYDPHNDAVKMLIGDYKDRSTVLARNAPIEVDVLPFELLFRKGTIYEEQDRERSLAFRLFRDGVRKMRFEPGLGWDDLVSLLEILSVRCNGVRQQEEDLITLLRKARFENITIESVEGHIPDEEMPENEALAPMVDEAESTDPLPDWDQPAPGPVGGNVQYLPVEEPALQALRSEETPAALAALAVRSVDELLQAARTLQDTQLFEQLVPFVEEVQHYLIVERNLNELARLAHIYRQMFGDGRTLPVLGEERSFERIMRMVTEDDEPIPAALYHLMGPVNEDIVNRALDMLVFGARGARRKALLEVVKHGARTNASIVATRLSTVPSDLIPDLFAILGEVAPTARVEAAFELVEQPDEALQLELLAVLTDAPKGLRLARALQALMKSPHEAVRIRATQLLGAVGGAKAIPLLAEQAKSRAAAGMSYDEADAVGCAMAIASVSDSLPALLEWSGSRSGLRSFLSRLRKDAPDERCLMFVAVAGLELCPGEEAEAAIEGVMARAGADVDLIDRCRRALSTRRGE